MTTEQRRKLADELETMVDRESLVAVVDILIEICGGKAEHLRSAWQDGAQAKDWDRNARELEKVNQRLSW